MSEKARKTPVYKNAYVIPRKQKRKKSKVKKNLLIVFIILAVLILTAVLILNAVAPKIVEISYAKINSMTAVMLNAAIFEVMSGSVKYGDLVTVEKDNTGAITLIEYNAVAINRLARDAAKTAEEKLLNLGDQEIKIPLGQLTGINFLSNRGIPVVIKINPYAAVNCNFISEFEEAGINQTRHKLYISVTTSVGVILPTYTGKINTDIEVLVAEGLIVGKVPEVYLNMKTLGGSSLDLTP